MLGATVGPLRGWLPVRLVAGSQHTPCITREADEGWLCPPFDPPIRAPTEYVSGVGFAPFPSTGAEKVPRWLLSATWEWPLGGAGPSESASLSELTGCPTPTSVDGERSSSSTARRNAQSSPDV